MPRKETRIDLHLHSTVSDGTDSPAELLERVRAAGVGVFSLTDHDAIRGCAEIQALLGPESPHFLPGVEFSCKDELGKYHILGYGCRAEAAALRELVELGHSQRMRKLEARLEQLSARFGITFSAAELAALRALPNPGKPHLGNLLVRLGYAETVGQAIRRYLDFQALPEEQIRPETAIAGILGSGGIPILAHPCFGSGEERILGRELADRVARLTGFGLQGLEALYSGFSPALTEEVLALAEGSGLCVTAGSDYHGQNKTVSLGETGLSPERPWPEGLRRFFTAVELL
jgi:Predicted metal-dependent phosphoesterases (PHP family)